MNLKLSEYDQVLRIRRHKVFELSPNGVLQAWHPTWERPRACSECGRSSPAQGMLYVGGDFTLVNGAQQNRFAMFQLVHG